MANASLGDQALALLLGSALGGGVRQILPAKQTGGGRGAYAERLAPDPIQFQTDLDSLKDVLSNSASPEQKATRNEMANTAMASSIAGMAGGIGGGIAAIQPQLGVDAHLGDLMDATQRQRALKAASAAARLAPVLASPYKTQAEKARLTSEYNTMFGDVNLPAKPYTTSQQAQLASLAALEQRRDEITQHSPEIPRWAITTRSDGSIGISEDWKIHQDMEAAKRAEKSADEREARAHAQELRLKALDLATSQERTDRKNMRVLLTKLHSIAKPDELLDTPEQFQEKQKQIQRITEQMQEIADGTYMPDSLKTPGPGHGAAITPEQYNAAKARANARGLMLLVDQEDFDAAEPGTYMAPNGQIVVKDPPDPWNQQAFSVPTIRRVENPLDVLPEAATLGEAAAPYRPGGTSTYRPTSVATRPVEQR